MQVLTTAKRFNVLKCGRRWGKTELAKELIIQPALDGFPVAYFAPTYKDLYDFWNELKIILSEVIEAKDEQVKQIRLKTKGKIDMWSMDEPDSGRGRKYKRVVIDECEKSGKLKEAWQGAIRPTLADYQGDCWFLSTPKFGRTFFKELFDNKDKYPNEWQAWRYSTYDNPFIKREEVDAAKVSLDPQYFDNEYMAMDVDLKGVIFKYALIDFFPETKWTAYGLDFGFSNDPTALIKVGLKDGAIYIEELIYETGLTNKDISEKMAKLGLTRYDEIIADCAEPKSIEELMRMGWNIKGAQKGKDSVMNGIDIMKRFNIFLTKDSQNTRIEFDHYRWAMDKEGRSTNEPVDMYNHAVDAVRYVVQAKVSKPVSFKVKLAGL